MSIANIFSIDWQVFGSGFLMQLGMIISIGLQNIYIIRKGIRKEFPFLIALTCVFCEGILIVSSTYVGQSLTSTFPNFKAVLTVIATIFLCGYGSISLFKAFRGKPQDNHMNFERPSTLLSSLILAVGFSLLNPQAIFEAMIFFGSVAPKFGEKASSMVLGAFLATSTWLFSLAAVSTYTFPRNPSAKFMRCLDGCSGLIMLGIAWSFSQG